LRAQYEHWVTEKDRVLESFVEKFNAYRTKKAEQLRLCEKEIVRLHEYTEQIEQILDGVEKGKYQVQQKQGLHGRSTTGLMASQAALGHVGMLGGGGAGGANNGGEGAFGGVVLPKGLKPTNPLLLPDDNDLELTKRIVGRHKERMKKLEKVKEEAFHKSLHQASSQSQSVTEVDPVLQKQIRDLLVSPSSRQGTRQRSSQGSRPSSGRVAGSSNSSSNQDQPQSQPLPDSGGTGDVAILPLPADGAASWDPVHPAQPTAEAPALSALGFGSAGAVRRAAGGSISGSRAGGSVGVTAFSAAESAMGELMLLRAEVAELRASRKIDQVRPFYCHLSLLSFLFCPFLGWFGTFSNVLICFYLSFFLTCSTLVK
jgi:hypothetical protein